jgi:signal transduction histidine kinase/ActR/RegA family two-component response regulator
MSRIKLLLVLISGCLVAASISLAVLITQRQETLRQVSRYNTSWLASQAVAEFTRLEQRISAFGQPGSGVDKDELELRYDILLNRIKLLDDGEFQDFVRRDGERRDIVERLSAAVAAAEPFIRQIEQPGAPNKLLSLLTPLDRDLALMASAANRYGAERVSEDQHDLQRLHLTFSALSGGLAVFGFGLILVLGRQNKFLERARADLSQQNTRFDVAINNMPYGLAMFDAQARLIVSNRRLPLVLGLAEAIPMTGLTLDEIADQAEREGRTAKASLFRNLVAALNGDGADSILHALPDGRTLALSRGLMAEGGFVCIFEDVTARIEAQTRREQLEEQLRQAQKMEAVGQLTGGIAHDFNNLLTVMLGNAELIVEGQTNSATVRDLAQMIMEAAQQGADLTQKLLAFGRRQSLKSEPVKLGDAVSGVTPLLRRALGEHIDLRTEFSGSNACALTDKALLESAILNLVVNARDAMPGGGSIAIKTGERQAEAGERNLEPGTRVVYLTVSDTGTGMPPEVIARAFEPFFTTKEVGKGSGLGLSMVYGFAEQSGGYVSIASKEGEGTSITIVLPATQAPALADEPDRDMQSAVRGEERVLVVEDEPHVLQFVSSLLRRLGYRVTAASTGAEAIMLLQQRSSFDLVFTDVVLPRGMSGIEVARQARVIDPHIRVLLTSGYAEEVFEQHGRPDEHTRLLSKPYKSRELARAVREALDTGRPPAPPRALAS